MILHVLFAQRKCTYEGEYAPEALEVCDEYTMDENPEWMEEKVDELLDSDEFSAIEVIDIDLTEKGFEDIKKRLNNNMVVKATVKK